MERSRLSHSTATKLCSPIDGARARRWLWVVCGVRDSVSVLCIDSLIVIAAALHLSTKNRFALRELIITQAAAFELPPASLRTSLGSTSSPNGIERPLRCSARGLLTTRPSGTIGRPHTTLRGTPAASTAAHRTSITLCHFRFLHRRFGSILPRHSSGPCPAPVELQRRTTAMSRNQCQTPRKPATKFAHLQKKMQKQKVQAKKPRKK